MIKNKSKTTIIMTSTNVEKAVPNALNLGINKNNDKTLKILEIIQTNNDSFSIDNAYIQVLIGASI